MTDRQLIERALAPVVSAAVAHYTRLATVPELLPALAPGAVGWGSAWATPVQFLNDRRELTLGLEVLRTVADTINSSRRVRRLIEALLVTRGRPETDAFQMSFSSNTDDPGQWRGYAADGMGCAVVTDARKVRDVADVAGWVIYDSKKQRVFARKVLGGLRGRKDTLNIEQTLVAAACFIKDSGFQGEEEFRLLCFAEQRTVRYRVAGERLVPYLDYLDGQPPLPVNGVVIGPGWQLHQLSSEEQARHHVVLGIRRLLDARGLHQVPVESSAIPYDPR